MHLLFVRANNVTKSKTIELADAELMQLGKLRVFQFKDGRIVELAVGQIKEVPHERERVKTTRPYKKRAGRVRGADEVSGRGLPEASEVA